jgi:hypothetical protein
MKSDVAFFFSSAFPLLLSVFLNLLVPEHEKSCVRPFTKKAVPIESPVFLWPDVPLSLGQKVAAVLRDVFFVIGVVALVMSIWGS